MADLFGLSVPVFAFLIFWLAYFLWSKLMNRGRLKFKLEEPSAVDKVAEILIIFTVLLITLVEYFSVALFFYPIKDMDLSATRITFTLKAITIVLGIITYFFILFFLGVHRKKGKQFNITDFFSACFFFQQALIVGSAGLFLGALCFIGGSLFPAQVFMLLFATLIAHLISRFFYGIAFTKKKKEHSTAYWVILIIIGLLVIAQTYALSPGIGLPQSSISQYEIKNTPDGVDERYEGSAEVTTRTYFSLDLPSMFTLYNLFKIPYHKDLVTWDENKEREIEFHTAENRSVTVGEIGKLLPQDNLQNNAGIISVHKSDGSKEIVFHFNPQTFYNLQFDGITLTETLETRINHQNYSFHDEKSCSNKFCQINVSITNSLESPVIQKNEMVLNSQSDFFNLTGCELKNPSYSIYGAEYNPQSVINECSFESCTIHIGLGERVAEAHWQKNNQTVEITYLNLARPLSLNMSVQVVCP